MTDIPLPLILNCTSRIAIIVASERGGVRKTSTSLVIARLLRDMRHKVNLIQVDQQGRLQRLFPGSVETIKVATAKDMRGDDLVDARRFAPVVDGLLDPQPGVELVDVGASNDGRLFEYFFSQDAAEECRAAGRTVLCFTPFTSDPDSVTLAARTAQRFADTFPESHVIPVVCEDGVQDRQSDRDILRLLADARCDFWRPSSPFVRHPRILPRALHLLETSKLHPFDFVDRANHAAIVESTGEIPSVVRQARADITVYIADFVTELQKVLTFEDA